MEKIKKVLAVLIICIVAALVVSPAVFAGEGGGGGGGGEWMSCSGTAFLSTECGAEWRYYKWGEAADGVSYEGNDVKIKQFYYGGEAADYAYGGTIKGCKEYGGYWRYAMVARITYYGYDAGSQVGLIGINGGGDWYFLSEEFDGGMNNLNPSSWKQAKKVYESYRKMDPDTFWRGWNSGSNLSWFCGGYDPIEERTLTGVAIDNKGNNMSGMSNVSDKVQKGSKASVTRQKVPTGWTYLGWGEKKDGKVSVTNTTYTVTTLNDDKTVYSVYEKNTFSGRATAINKDNKESSTGWVNSDKTADTMYIDCPAPTATCSAKIKFDIKRTGGSGETKYTIYNNSGSIMSGYNNVSTSGGKLDGLSFDVGLKVGETVCLSMEARASEADDKWFTVKACVAAPYNFTSSTEPTISDEEIIYSGEEKTVEYTVSVNEKKNNTVGKTYCTPAPNSDHGIQVRYGDDSYRNAFVYSEKNDSNTEKLNCGDSPRSGTIIIDDVPAGTRICVRTFITPSNSGSDTNLKIDNFNYEAAYSKTESEKCYTAAKRPNMKVLGGSYYSGRRTETSTALKHADGKVKVYGSWAEQSVIGVGTINGFASGSANYSNLDDKTDFCKYRTLLTFNNTPCSGNGTSKGIGVAAANDNRDALVDYWVADSINLTDKQEIGVNDGGNIVYTIAGNPVSYVNSQADLTISGGTIAAGSSRIIKTSGDVTISGNINYDGELYSSVSQIPKLIISARNIIISCGVDKIDGILIAKGWVNTCNSFGSSGEANETDRNRQLTIGGMVIANKLIPSRTYGAGKEAESSTPAEIINYDSSTMLWAQYMAGNADSGALTVTYQRELAPRY